MATSFKDICQKALFRIHDPKLMQLSQDEQEAILYQYLHSAIADFQNKCKIDLSEQSSEEADSPVGPEHIMFVNDLDNEIKEILALGISYYWLSACVMNEELLRNRLSTKDYTYFSPANLLREMTELRDKVKKEYKDRIIRYTYDHGNIAMEE